MKIKYSNKDASSQTSEIKTNGFIAKDYLLLVRNPRAKGEAATLEYVSRFPYELPVSLINNKPVTFKSLAACFKGDVSSFNNTQLLLNVQLAAGSYSRVQVNSKGLITGGTLLTQDQSPPTLAFTSIISLPTSISQYLSTYPQYVLSTAAYSTTMTANLLLQDHPAAANQAATYHYLTSTLGQVQSTYQTARIAIKPNTLSHSGFVKLDGAMLAVSTYPNLYAEVGVTHGAIRVIWGVGIQGQPWRTQNATNTTTTSTTASWTSATNLPIRVTEHSCVATKNYAYLIGGKTGTPSSPTPSKAVYISTINSSGTLGTWSNANKNLPGTLSAAQAVLTATKLYLIGGNYNNGSSYRKVFSCPVNADGTLGNWTAEVDLPQNYPNPVLVVTRNQIYLLGGGASNTIYRCTILPDDSLSTWVADGTFPIQIKLTQPVVTTNQVLIFGGVNSQTGAALNTLYKVPIDTDGYIGSWSTGTNLSVTLEASCSAITNTIVYIFGGKVGGTISGNTYSGVITTGVPTALSAGKSLATARMGAQVLITSSKLYVLGGQTPSAFSNACQHLTFTGDTNDYPGQIKSSPTQVTHFKLPDLTAHKDGIYEYYIRA